MKKAFTLIEITIAISVIIILSSSSALIYKYYLKHSKEKIIASYGEQIFQAVHCMYEEGEGNLDEIKIVEGVKDLTNCDVSVDFMNMDEKLINLRFNCEGRDSLIKIDLIKSCCTVIDIVGDRIIYEY